MQRGRKRHQRPLHRAHPAASEVNMAGTSRNIRFSTCNFNPEFKDLLLSCVNILLSITLVLKADWKYDHLYNFISYRKCDRAGDFIPC